MRIVVAFIVSVASFIASFAASFALLGALTTGFALVGCVGASSELAPTTEDPGNDSDGGGSGSGGSPGQIASCIGDEDCIAVGARCCDCPTYATRADDPAAGACNEVDCPMPDELQCSRTQAVCREGACVLACEPQQCSSTCEFGYVRDASGCLTCECAVPPPGGCTGDSQCSRVAADCCGCSRGGADTAVRAGSETSHYEMLGCSSDSACPEVDTCVAGDAPHCIQGSCTLAQPLPPGACGRPDLPACAACMVNANDQADSHGVGICQSP